MRPDKHIRIADCGDNVRKKADFIDWRIRKWQVLQEIDQLKRTAEKFKEVHSPWLSRANGSGNVKTILYWNTMYAEKHRHFMFGTGDVFRDCPVSHCYGTPNRSLMKSLQDYDAILFHGIEMNIKDLPTARSDFQRYIFFSWESSASRPINDLYFVLAPNFYNWTMSYRLDSDIRRPYGRVRDLLTREIVAPPGDPGGIVPWRSPDPHKPSDGELEIIKSKRKIAAWFVSHCDTRSRRETLVKELGKYFEVDTYGKCGDLECDRNNNDECYDLLERDYFFYFSFENTLCRDYVTEKLFLPMSRYVIPVVYGGADYSKFVPPHSYINIMDFNSTHELAEYLIRLSMSPVQYASYFWWKSHYLIEDTTKSTLCDLCEKLHNDQLPKKSIDNFTDYYLTDQCYSPGNLSWSNSMYLRKN
ncbi:alpha-(1,3)-fucosyltransferase C-like [Fopius arisanus]|uniref:Fucosyltransferase n=1 Tax=Fopius arisanus TaxID=64838 RepID=A0A9R1TDD3_9HYME|nr:PREDICTED: alpha-(1,3)-fucosyltransferase C-like [Fopius arisanus]